MPLARAGGGGVEGGARCWGGGLGPAPQVLIFPWHPRLGPDGSAQPQMPGPGRQRWAVPAAGNGPGEPRYNYCPSHTVHQLSLSSSSLPPPPPPPPPFFFFSKLPQSGSNMLRAC